LNRKLLPILLLASFCLWFAAPRASAWDAVGHAQIADIAWTKLTPHTKADVIAILEAGDPAFRPASPSDSDRRAAFRKASTYCDVIKGDRTTQYESIIPEMNLTFFKTQKLDPDNREDNTCKTWHYYDTPIRDKGKHPAEDSNAINAFNLACEKLISLKAGKTPDRKMQCWWLYWVEHIAGDVHQPLHCVSSYEFFPDTGDAGGNRLRITDPARPDRPGNLHSFWDAGITHAIAKDKAAGLPVAPEDITARWCGDKSLAPDAQDAKDVYVKDWVKAGAEAADKIVYADLKPNSTLTPEYAATQITFCRKQAVLAGTRLAEVLNELLDAPLK
jgi:hypothetical protein